MQRRLEDALANVAAFERLEHRLCVVFWSVSSHLPCNPRSRAACDAAARSASSRPSSSATSSKASAEARVAETTRFWNSADRTRLFLVQRAKYFLRGLVELRPGAHEVEMIAIDELALFGRQRQPIARREDRVDSGEEACIEMDRVGMRGEARCDLYLQILQRIVGVRARDRVKGTQRTGHKSPLRSSASSVFSKVAGADCAAMMSTSASCWRIPSSIAGRKCSS